MSKELGITPRGENFAEWYNDLVNGVGKELRLTN